MCLGFMHQRHSKYFQADDAEKSKESLAAFLATGTLISQPRTERYMHTVVDGMAG